MESVILIWLAVIVFNLVARFMKRGRGVPGKDLKPYGGGNPYTPQPQTSQPGEMVRAKTKTVRAPAAPPLQNLKKKNVTDASCETQYGHVHPERGQAMRFGGRPDLEPGYMYLNGVKVLIKEADHLEFLR